MRATRPCTSFTQSTLRTPPRSTLVALTEAVVALTIGRHIRSSVMLLAMKPIKRVSAPSIAPTKPKALPRPGQRTYLGCAYLYIEQALAELSPSGRREVAKDLRAYIDLLVSETSEVDDEP